MDIDTQPVPHRHDWPVRKRARSYSPESYSLREAKRPNRAVVAQRALTPAAYSPAHSPRDQLSSQAEGLRLATPRDSPHEMVMEDLDMQQDGENWSYTERRAQTIPDDSMMQDHQYSYASREMQQEPRKPSPSTPPRPHVLRSTSMPLAPVASPGRRCQRLVMGFRHDCEMCRAHVPNHHAHILSC